MKVFIEKHIYGYCLVYAEGYNKGFDVAEGEPHMRGTVYRKSRKEITNYAEDNGMEVV